MNSTDEAPASIEVRRAGKTLGPLTDAEFEAKVQRGELLPTDLCRDEASPDLVPLEVFLKRRSNRVFAKAEILDEPPPPRPHRSSRSGRRERMMGLVLALSVIIALGCGAWGIYQSLEVERLTQLYRESQRQLEQFKQSAPGPAQPVHEVLPKGTIRGRAILRDTRGKRSVVPGMKVRLYRRADIEQYLESRLPAMQGRTEAEIVLALLSGLPHPLATTTSDSSGVFEFTLPDEDFYVLQTSTIERDTRAMRLWLVGFDSGDALNTPIAISDANAARSFDPVLIFTEGR